MSKKENNDRWFVVYCKDDDSHSLVPDVCVIYDENISIGDEVKFSLHKRDRKFYVGVIAAVGDDYDALKKIQDDLNLKNKPKREHSFHAENPRRAAVKCKEKNFSSKKTRSYERDFSSSAKMKEISTKSTDERSRLQEAPRSSKKTSNTIVPKVVMAPREDPEEGLELNMDKVIHSSAKKPSTSETVLSKVLNEGKNTIYTSSSAPSSSSEEDVEAQKVTPLSFKPKGDDALSNKSLELPTDESDNGMSGEEMTPAEINLLKRLAKKNKALDIQSLLALPSKRAQSTLANKEKKEEGSNFAPDLNLPHSPVQAEDSSVLSVAEAMKGSEFTDQVEHDLSCNAEPTPNVPENKVTGLNHVVPTQLACAQDETKDVVKRKASRPRFGETKYQKLAFEGEFYRYNATDDKVVKILPDFDVYLRSSVLKTLKAKCKTATSLARSLVREVFSDKALAECSVSGKPSKKRGSDTCDVRPALDPDGIVAILEFVKARATKKGWDKPNEVFLKQAMASTICDDRLCANAAAAKPNSS